MAKKIDTHEPGAGAKAYLQALKDLGAEKRAVSSAKDAVKKFEPSQSSARTAVKK